VAGGTAQSPEELTRQEVRLQRVLLVLAAVFAVLALGYVLQGLLADAEFPFVANSTAKDTLFAILCLVAANDLRRFGWAAVVVIIGHVLLITGLVVMLIWDETLSAGDSFVAPPGFALPPAHVLLLVWLGLAVAVTGLLIVLYRSAVASRHPLQYLRQHQHRTLTALAEVLVLGDAEVLSAEQIADEVRCSGCDPRSR
jgi:hypothetical protein